MNLKSFLPLFILFVVTLVYGQVVPKGTAIAENENTVISQYGLDASQQQSYNLLKADVKNKLNDMDSLKSKDPEGFYKKRSEVIYQAKMQLKQMLNPEQRRIWREREEALHELLLQRKKELEEEGKTPVEIQKELTEFDVF